MRVVWFDVQHGWEVGRGNRSVAQEVAGLKGCGGCREKVVAAYFEACGLGGAIVFLIIRVEQPFALGAFQVNEADGIVDVTRDALFADGSEAGDAEFAPIDGVVFAAFDVLVLGNVDAVDAVAGVRDSLAAEAVALPFAGFQTVVGGYSHAESVAPSGCPVAFVVDAV